MGATPLSREFLRKRFNFARSDRVVMVVANARDLSEIRRSTCDDREIGEAHHMYG